MARNHAPKGQGGEYLYELEKAVTSESIQDIVPESLEEEAHSVLWRSTSPFELTLMKLCPSRSTHKIKHEYDKITSYGHDQGYGGYGTFTETSLPLETAPEFERVETFIRLLGEHSSTFLLASLQKTIKVEGVQGAAGIARKTLQLNLLKKKNRALYFMDTSTIRNGAASARFKGLAQQIREGTDGTTGTSPFGSHSIDMQGLPFTVQNVRDKTAEIITQFGFLNCILMDPLVRAALEGSMDPAQRLPLPIGMKPFMLGQHIGGVTTNGGQAFFHTDNTLSPQHSKGKYRGTATDQAPGAPVVSGSVTGTPVSGTSLFIAGDAADMFWIVTEMKNERESLGTRYPSSGYASVSVGDEVALVITPNDPLSDSFKIYRGTSDDAANTDAWFIFEVANDNNGGNVTAYDLNQRRPNTSEVFGLNIRSASQELLHTAPSGERTAYNLAQLNAENFLGMEDDETNTVTVVELGPRMGVMELAKMLAQTSRPLLYSACAMQVRNPLQNVHWYNIGRS